MLAELRTLFKRIALNSLWLLIARASSQGLMILFTVLVARYLGQVGLGQYAFVAAVVFLGNVLTTFGLDTLLIREVARTREEQGSVGAGELGSRGAGEQRSRGEFASAPPYPSASAPLLTAGLWLQLGLSALFIGGITVAAGWLPNKTPETVLALRLYSLSLIPLAFTTVFSASLRAHERMDLILVLNLLSAAVQTGGALALLGAGGGLVALVAFLLAVQSLTALVAGGMCFRRLPGFALAVRVPGALLGRMLRLGAPLAAVAVLMVAYQRMEVLALSLLADDAATGWFAAAARITDALKMLHYAYFGAVFPLMSRLAVDAPLPGVNASPRTVERRLYRASFSLLLGFGLGTALIVTPLASPVIRLLYGAGYGPSVPALQILVWALVPFAVSSHVFFWLVSNGREMTALRVIVVTVAATALLNLLLIPRFGLIGACLAALAGEGMQALLYVWQVARGEGRIASGEGRVARYEGRVANCEIGISLLATRNSPLATGHSPLRTRHSPLRTRHAPLRIRYSPLKTDPMNSWRALIDTALEVAQRFRRPPRLRLRGGYLVLPTGVVQADLVLDGGRIVAVERYSTDSSEGLRKLEGRAARTGERVVDVTGLLVFPGLINAHDHLELNSFPRLGRPQGYGNAYEWGLDITQKRRPPIVDEVLRMPLRERLLEGGYKNLRSGVTTVCHHGPYHRLFDRGFPVRVVKRYGWCHSLGFGDDVVGSYRRTPPDAPWIIHLAEGTDETAGGELQRLAEMGCLGPNTVIVHGVALDEPDIERMARHGAGLIWCPASNLFLFGQTAPIERLKGRVTIALGSDSRLTGSQDLLAELKVARSLGVADDEELFHMVTRDAARLLRIDHETGTIEPGKRADLLVLAGDVTDPYRTLVTAEREAIRLVIVGGCPVSGEQ